MNSVTEVRRTGRKTEARVPVALLGWGQSGKGRVRLQSVVRVSTRHPGAAGPRAQGNKDARERAGKPRCHVHTGPAGGDPDTQPAEPAAFCLEAG